VVDIDVVLGGTQRAAGTGMVLTSDGEVLTNRHVVEGETSISVTVAATGRIYSARVVGISTTTDVAVVQLVNASGLATVKTSTSAVRTGDSVVGVGNAGGTGGRPSAAAGTVTGVDQSITASDTDGSNPERLTGLVETDAGIQPGDSGGPLLNSSDQAVGMDTAASAQGNDGYAIPIGTALAVARQIEAGGSGTRAGAGATATTSSHGYLGVEVADGADGAEVAGVVEGSPAARAGMTAGDTITSVAGHQVGSVSDLSTVMSSLSPGQRVAVAWVGQDGASHTARVTLTGQ
jgi:S1-C subfamily serine protease